MTPKKYQSLMKSWMKGTTKDITLINNLTSHCLSEKYKRAHNKFIKELRRETNEKRKNNVVLE